MSGALVAFLGFGGVYEVTVEPAWALGVGLNSTVTTGAVQVTVEPAGSYSYQWSRVSGDTSITISGPGSPFVNWTATGMVHGETRSAVWRCRVLSEGVQIGSVTVPVDIERT